MMLSNRQFVLCVFCICCMNKIVYKDRCTAIWIAFNLWVQDITGTRLIARYWLQNNRPTHQRIKECPVINWRHITIWRTEQNILTRSLRRSLGMSVLGCTANINTFALVAWSCNLYHYIILTAIFVPTAGIIIPTVKLLWSLIEFSHEYYL